LSQAFGWLRTPPKASSAGRRWEAADAEAALPVGRSTLLTRPDGASEASEW